MKTVPCFVIFGALLISLAISSCDSDDHTTADTCCSDLATETECLGAGCLWQDVYRGFFRDESCRDMTLTKMCLPDTNRTELPVGDTMCHESEEGTIAVTTIGWYGEPDPGWEICGNVEDGDLLACISSPEECDTYTTEAECRANSCTPIEAHPALYDGDTCTGFAQEKQLYCTSMLSYNSASAMTPYYRATEDGTEIILAPALYGGLQGWEACPTHNCGCGAGK